MNTQNNLKLSLVSLLFLVIFLSNAFAQAQESLVKLNVKANVTLDLQNDVTLDQLLESPPKNELQEDLQKVIVLAKSDKTSVVISSVELSKKLRHLLKEIEIRTGTVIQVNIPSSVLIESPRNMLSKDLIVEKLLAQMIPPCPSCRYTIEELRLPTIPKRFAHQTWKVRLINDSPRGQFNFELFLEDSNQGKTWGNTKFWGSGFAHLAGKVAVLKNHQMIGATVNPGELTWEERNLTYTRGVPIQEDLLKGAVLKKSKVASDILWMDDFEKKIAVKKNETVKVMIGDDSWQIHLTGVALKQGYVGDRIEVMNPSSKKTFSAEIISDGNVRVE